MTDTKELEQSGLTPIPAHLADQFQSAEGLVRVHYATEYRCAICGHTPHKFGCIPALENHLKDKHNVFPDKPLWIDSLTDTEIRRFIHERVRT